MVKKKIRILVCPLNWGIGHATRCVPIIRALNTTEAEVIIAADGRPYDFLKQHFPWLTFIRFPGFRVTYPSGSSMAFKILLQVPGILTGIWREHRLVKKIIQEHKIDMIISDNRFGLWSKRAYSVYLTHQVMIKSTAGYRWMEPILYRMHRWFIDRYDECWVPDIPGPSNLSGDLSHRYPLPSHGSFIGILSRFEKISAKNTSMAGQEKNKLLVIISGPEPQRKMFEKIVLEELKSNLVRPAVILQGLPGKSSTSVPFPGVTVYNHLTDEKIRDYIVESEVIICRPGYSTLMDLVKLEKSAVLIPTPGQTEQEYLAEHLSADGLFAFMDQDGFHLPSAMEAAKKLPGKGSHPWFNIINTFGQEFTSFLKIT